MTRLPFHLTFVRWCANHQSINQSINLCCRCNSICLDDEVSIKLEVYVDKGTAPLLTSGKDQIDDILVLHLQGGKDLFVSFNDFLVLI